jgi:DNA-directed RNA polymerase II subunit RPB1
VNGSIVQFRYGGDGIDSSSVEVQPCDLAIITMETVYREFAAPLSDFAMVCSETLTEAPDMVEQILADRDILVKDIFRYIKKDTVIAPVHLGRIVEKYNNPYATKTNLTPSYVVSELNKLCDQGWLKHHLTFHILLRFYLAPKKSIIKLRLSKDMFDELLREISFKYIKSTVHAGEMVGTLAAQSIGEPTTQLTLNTFHSAGTSKANATQGVPRIVELLSVSRNPKNPSNVVYLNPSISASQNSAIAKMKEIQKTTVRDITKSVRIYYDPNPLASNTAVQEDQEILRSYEKFSIAQGNMCASPWIMRLEFDPMEMAARNIMDMTMIGAKIQNNKVLRVFDCVHSDTNAPDKIVMRIVFGTEVVKNALSLRFIEDKVLDVVLTGVDGIGRVYPREVSKELLYDENVGGYVSAKQYVLDVEGTNLLDLSSIPNTDPFRSFSNDIYEVLEVFGIETVRVMLYEEFMEVFTTEYVNYHHMITLIDTMTFPGRILEANRFGMNKSESGVLAKSSFEETSKILFNAALSADFDNMRGVSANIMFGQKPPCGTGFVDILIDETKLPDGSEEVSVFEAELSAANQHVEELENKPGCQMEDILMEW